MKKLLLGLLCVVGGLVTGGGAEIGSPAAALNVSQWIKGKSFELSAAKGKQVVVVEFWATYCPPCLVSIPRLTELQKKFPEELVVVGLTSEDAGVVKKFVAKMGEKMDYRVALDDEGKTYLNYAGAFGLSGIPYAFVVDKAGEIIWVGHPLDGLETVVAEVLAGRLTVANAKARQAAMPKLAAFYQAANQGMDLGQLEQLGKEVQALDDSLGGIQIGRRFDLAGELKAVKFQGLLQKYQMAVFSGLSGTNLTDLENVIQSSAPPDFNFADFKELFTLEIAFRKYYMAAIGHANPDKLPEYARELRGLKVKNVQALNKCAWIILTDGGIKNRDLELAATLAKTGLELSGGKDIVLLDTYSRVLFASGKVPEAVAQLEKAISLSPDENLRKQFTETVKQYQESATAKTTTGS